MSIPNGRRTVGHPVDIATGAVTLEQTDVDISCRIALTWTRYYSTARIKDPESRFGIGWRTNYSATLKSDLEGFTFVPPEGDNISFDDTEGILDSGGTIIDFGAFTEIFKRENEYVVSQWEIKTNTITRYLFRPISETPTWPVNRIEDVTGEGLAILYDTDGKLDTIIETRGNRRLTVRYNNQDLVSEIWLEGGDNHKRLVSHYDYDSVGCLVSAYDPGDVAQSYRYDERGRLIREIRRDRGVFSFFYDRHDRCVRTHGLNNYDAQTLVYNEAARQTQVTDSLDGNWLYQWGQDGQVERIISPMGLIKSIDYDTHGRIIAEGDARGLTKYEFDDVGNLARIENPLGQADEFTYDEHRRPTSHKDRAGNKWLREQDQHGRLIAEMDPAGARWEYRYNDRGDLVQATNPNKDERVFQYDAYGELIRISDWQGHPHYYERDIEGRIIRETDSLGAVTTIEYDVRGNPKAVTQPDGSVIRLAYDAEGHLRERIDAAQRRTIFRYGTCGRLMEIEYPDRATVKFTWSSIPGQLTKITNEIGEEYRYEYDADGRLVREIGFDGQEYDFRYDEAGWCVYVSEAGRETRFERDALGRITREIFHDGLTSSFEYDELDNIETAENNDCVVTLQWDFSGRIVKETCGDHSIESEYDVFGSRLVRRSDLGHTDHFTFTADGDMLEMTVGSLGTIKFQRDQEGQEVERRFNSRMSLRQERDHQGRPVRQQVSVTDQLIERPRPSGRDVLSGKPQPNRRIIDREIKYDPSGNLIEVEDNRSGTTRYSYGRRGFLRSVTRTGGFNENYNLDPAGNILQADYESGDIGDQQPVHVLPIHERNRYAEGGRLLTKNDTEYEYDQSGKLIRKVVDAGSPSPQIWEYEWNSSGLLKSVKRPDQEVWRYVYDPFGRRIRKEGPAYNAEFVWDGINPLHEIRNESDGSTWLFEEGTFRPIAKIEAGRACFCINDSLGTPRELLSSSGEILWTASQTAWGRETDGQIRTEGTGASIDCPLRFQGQWYDFESGLCYNRHRYYDPETGRYLSKDPIGLLGGLNQYSYPADPINWFDPLGLSCGRQGERIARKYLRKLGFDILGSIQNKSGHGIDLVARDRAGNLWFFEVKTTEGTVVPRLSPAQAHGASFFVPSRLGRAQGGTGHWANVHDPATAARATSHISEIAGSGGTVRGEVIEVNIGNRQITRRPW
jgi:RHS repeat-associated protein